MTGRSGYLREGGPAGLLSGSLLRVASFTGKWLGFLVFFLARGRRRTALANLDIAYGDRKSSREKRGIARASFENLGRNAAEILLFPFMNRQVFATLVSYSGEHHLREALGRGRGVLLLSCHLGNWDLLAASLAGRGYPIAAITKIPKSDLAARIWMGHRERMGVRLLKGRGLLKEAADHLGSGGAVGFVLDQNARRSEGVFVPFFGRDACTLKSLALLARRTGAPVVPVYIYRNGRGHRAVIDGPLENGPAGSLHADIVEKTRRYTLWTERIILLHPEQWTWLHQRWKTRPRKDRPTSSNQGPMPDVRRLS